jgi:hypothetical protein
METSTPKLTTAGQIVDAYQRNFITDPSQRQNGKTISSEELHALLRAKPIHESVNAFIERKLFDLAVVYLDSAYMRNNPGSLADRELAKLGMDMAEVCLKEKKLNFVEWGLNRAYEIYPEGSPERRQVIERGVSLVDDFTGKGGSLYFAEVLLLRSLELYPEGSDERRQAIEKQEAIAKQRRAANALGSRTEGVTCLAKPPRRRGFSGMAGMAG